MGGRKRKKSLNGSPDTREIKASRDLSRRDGEKEREIKIVMERKS